ncbi:hypothetical protein [Fischerella thermalis]|uniref:hypothetical protein n=1 Tax=Fischerella thermalis TaxID=372787 RepID=UPI000C800127|nr:hypothetical protein [Fischerella thermalis]PLZ05208.1 hypothetical protein CBP19_22410 [Fischerella thermalis WC1110]PLZ38197.1 hypothetical protein CBP26_16025 [Fischerella thermalis WC538]PLZ40492.1 hypothetical protein CBP25_19165 [Fischerella thermalis WC527]PLZ50080.1 hypothetical protein CBP13_17085 [Fischerella thermalis WC441]PLZ58572.1 hypothetical protein CBP23_21595 [Fischerella thermalis WC344]
MTELYKAGIIEVTEAEAEDEDEDLFEVAVHFDGDIFLPSVVFEGKDHALRQAKKLYDWLEANPKEIKGERLRWQSYTVNRESLREYPACYLPYYYYSRYEQSLEVSIFERDQEAIAYGWLSAEPLPYYVDKENSLVVIGEISDDAVLAGWHKATDISSYFYSFN